MKKRRYNEGDVVREADYAKNINMSCGCDIRRVGRKHTRYEFENFCEDHDPTVFKDSDELDFPFEAIERDNE